MYNENSEERKEEGDKICLYCGLTHAYDDLIPLGERYICKGCDQTRKTLGFHVHEIPLESKGYVPKDLF